MRFGSGAGGITGGVEVIDRGNWQLDFCRLFQFSLC